VPDFRLLNFQEIAAESLQEAALAWMRHAADEGPPRYGATEIPFMGQLRAVTGAGKTPILAAVVAGLGDAVILWTTKSSAVVEQTYNNLLGKYNKLLLTGRPPVVLRDIPSRRAWRELLDDKRGLTIWLLTTASWNEAEAAASAGSEDARLNLHRPHQDWAGDRSPWDLLRTDLKRPLWVVSDESHNQTSTQLDQLAALGPVGFFMASATPVASERFQQWTDAANTDPTWQALGRAAIVRVSTKDVVEKGLLKTTLEVVDFNSGTEESLEGALAALSAVEDAAKEEGASVEPRAIYVVEQSNPRRGSTEEPRPVIIWRYLRSQGVPADEIAVYTDTKELPSEAVRVNSLAHLHSRYRHIIFNQSLQEGWDDPEAYVCYFDGITRSVLRVRQIVGRVLRQPSGGTYESERLNTATLIIQTPTETYDSVITGLRAELRVYAPDDEPTYSPIRLKTRREPLNAIPVKAEFQGKLTVPQLALEAPNMRQVEARLMSSGARPYRQEDLDAPGLGRRDLVDLSGRNSDKREYIDVVRSARNINSMYFKRKLVQINRNCANAVHPDSYSGPMFKQLSCFGSVAQDELAELAAGAAAFYEDRVKLVPEVDPQRATWVVDAYRPRTEEYIPFRHAAHDHYSRGDLNTDERPMAEALDRLAKGVWTRNPSTPGVGFGIPLPMKVDRGSSNFFPDFLWWVDDSCFAIETTGRYLLDAKVRGKLLPIDVPSIVFIVRGRVNLVDGTQESADGWSLVRARPGGQRPLTDFKDDLDRLLQGLLD
jgi:type III restriction enzyme